MPAEDCCSTRPAGSRWRAGPTGSNTLSTSATNWTRPPCCCGRTATGRGRATISRICSAGCPDGSETRRPGRWRQRLGKGAKDLRPGVEREIEHDQVHARLGEVRDLFERGGERLLHRDVAVDPDVDRAGDLSGITADLGAAGDEGVLQRAPLG